MANRGKGRGLGLGLLATITLGLVGLATLFVAPWIGVAILIAALFVLVTVVFYYSEPGAGSLGSEETSETMAHRRRPGI